MSNASEVYIHLGVEAVESWTQLKDRYEAIKIELQDVTCEVERDRLMKEMRSTGIRINKIEEEAEIPANKRTS